MELTKEEAREAILSQICPFCGRGPFIKLSCHTAYVEGVTAAELRAVAEVYKATPTCSEELSLRHSEIAKSGKYYLRMIGHNYSPKRELSLAGKRQRRDFLLENKGRIAKSVSETRKRMFAEGRLKNNSPPKPHNCPTCGKIVPKARPVCCSPECRSTLMRQIQWRTTQNKKLKIPRDKYTEITERIGNDETKTQIAKEYGVSRALIRYILRKVNSEVLNATHMG